MPLFQVKIFPFRLTLPLLVTLRHSGSSLLILPSNLILYEYGGELICSHGDGEGHLWVLAGPCCEGLCWARLVPGLGALYWCPYSEPSHAQSLKSPAAYINFSHILPVQSTQILWSLCSDPKALLDHWCSQLLCPFWDNQELLRCLHALSSLWKTGNIFLGPFTGISILLFLICNSAAS